ncbi:hypothetical protein EES39_17310 [Streptomyces sp. ADI92-24]|uniref:hypothetical protein n=1 Tax=unclassified Streptomyces TaxID=2593676 RepID=UPI000F55842B|nr:MULTISPECIES: hypothetical protein [unclassified Streptomyces]ROQ82442.1 hypothetical protein EDD95_2058 [Streptomyces sp. CEV 2-1]RPK44529.1 hypothetical protein EES39_17310 [Streptomyces sp. ADI92-24]
MNVTDSAEIKDADRTAIPRELREIHSPWNDLRGRADSTEFPHTADGAQTALAALRALFVPTRFRLRGWSEEQLELLDAMHGEWRLLVVSGMPTTADLTWDGVVDAITAWFAEFGGEGPVLLGPDDCDLLNDITGAWVRWIKASLAHRTLTYLLRCVECEDTEAWSGPALDRAALASAAERSVHEGIGVQSFALLRAIGGPQGEASLARLCAGPLDVYDRTAAREALWGLRRRSYPDSSSLRVRPGESLVPSALSEAAIPWSCGFVDPDVPHEPLPYTPANLRLVQRALAGCEAVDVPPWSEFPPDTPVPDNDPDLSLVELDTVLAAVVPYASMFTRENLAVAQRECRLLGIVAEPDGGAEGVQEPFVSAAVFCLVRAITGGAFDWLARNPEPESAERWSVEAAMRAVRRGVADKRAMQLLLWSDTELSRRALAQIESDTGLPGALRDAVSDGVDLY